MQKVLPGGADRKALCRGNVSCASTTFAEVLSRCGSGAAGQQGFQNQLDFRIVVHRLEPEECVRFCGTLHATRSFRICAVISGCGICVKKCPFEARSATRCYTCEYVQRSMCRAVASRKAIPDTKFVFEMSCLQTKR